MLVIVRTVGMTCFNAAQYMVSHSCSHANRSIWESLCTGKKGESRRAEKQGVMSIRGMEQHLSLAIVVSGQADRVERSQPEVARLSEIDRPGKILPLRHARCY